MSAEVVGITRFGTSDGFTLGVEEELQLVDPETGDLVSRADSVLAKGEPRYEDELQSELFQSMVETATPVCEDVDELREQMARLRGLVHERGQADGFRIAASGTHPFAAWEEQELTREERYEQLLEDLRLPIKRELVFGQHVHVAVGSAAEAITVTNAIRSYLPLLLALSANSPFWRGIDSGLASARLRVFDAMPRSGLPRTFADWADLEGAVQLLKDAGSIEDMTKIWWDVRPRPTLGTVEVRIADLPTRLEDSHALAAFTQALVARLATAHREGDELPVGVHPEAAEENRWRAIRSGLEASFIELDPEGEVRTVPLAEVFDRTMVFLEPTIDELGLKDEIARLVDRVGRGETGADRQRRIHEEAGSLRAVVDDIAERTPP